MGRGWHVVLLVMALAQLATCFVVGTLVSRNAPSRPACLCPITDMLDRRTTELEHNVDQIYRRLNAVHDSR